MTDAMDAMTFDDASDAPDGVAAPRCRPAITAVIRNVAGWDDLAIRPQNNTPRIAVSPDGTRVAVVWQHNLDAPDVFVGEATAYAAIGDPSDATSFGTTPTVVGRNPFPQSASCAARPSRR